MLATSAGGAWVELCQGDPPTKVLVVGAGAGEPIDDVYAQDPSGRYVVTTLGAATTLLDSVSGARVDLSALGADVRRVRQDYAAHRTLSFSADGQRLAYLRRQAGQLSIVVRELASGTEQAFSPGPGDVFRLKLSADARLVTFEALREDTSKNGKLDWPAPEEPPSRGSCEKPVAPKFRSFAYQGRGDSLTRAVLSLDDGTVRDVPELVTPLGESLVLRGSDGSLKLERRGKRTPLAPASCAGRVLAADAERELLLVACSLPKKPGKRGVWLFGAGFAKDLQSELYETSTDRDAVRSVRLIPLYPGSDAALVDLERRELLPLAPSSRVLAVTGATALLWRGHELFRYDARSRSEVLLAGGVLKNPDLLRAGDAVLLSPYVLVDAAQPLLTSPTERPLALSVSGHVLAAAGDRPGAAAGAGAARAGGAIEGPLHWLDARVSAPDGPSR